MVREEELALPDHALMERVRPVIGFEDFDTTYLEVGRMHRDRIVELLPADWSFADRTVLDLGCGAGRVLRHFAPEATEAGQFWGCDVHAPSIEWLAANFVPPFRVFVNDDRPPLPLADASVDLVYAVSVFSHLSVTASEWLLELRRILKPDGLLLATFQGPSMWGQRGTAATDPPLDDVGHHVWGEGITFSEGDGPQVFMAEWWLREHWGRAFDVSSVEKFTRLLPYGQDVAILRPNGRACTADEIDAPNTDDPREIRGLATSRRLMLAEVSGLRDEARSANDAPRSLHRGSARTARRPHRRAATAPSFSGPTGTNHSDAPPFPLPPDPLLTRVGRLPASPEAAREAWQAIGQRCHDMVVSVLPSDWSFDGKTVLDFGCGAGRVLRYFHGEADRAAQFWGSDVHAPSIEWLADHLCPPFRVFHNHDVPPLPFDDESVDLVYSFSVFSHLSDTSAAWLLELRRILRPDGYAMLTFHGPGLYALRGDAASLPDLEIVGRTTWGQGRGFYDTTGPDTFQSAWWTREHWGRAFDIERLEDEGVPFPPFTELHGRGQGFVLMRPNGRPCMAAEIEAPASDDPREVTGLIADRELMLTELGHLRHQAEAAQAEYDAIVKTKSWRITAPLRAVHRAARELRSRAGRGEGGRDDRP